MLDTEFVGYRHRVTRHPTYQEETPTEDRMQSAWLRTTPEMFPQFPGTQPLPVSQTTGTWPPQTVSQFPRTQPPPVSQATGTWPPQTFPQPTGKWQPQGFQPYPPGGYPTANSTVAMMGQMMSLFQQMQIERDRERQEAMTREERLAAESREDRSLLKSLLAQSQSSMTATHTPSQPRSSRVDLSSVVGKNGVGKMRGFDGDASTWPDWWESFKRRIDETEANPIDKLDAL